jgi:hypothetical protein
MKFSASTFITVAALGFSTAAFSQTTAQTATQTSPQTTALKNDSASAADFWRVTVSPAATYHFSRSPDHKAVVLLGLEKQYANSTLLGGALFTNSFGQPSFYGYGGKHIANLMSMEPLFLQWTVGVVYGYKGEFKDKVPLNYQGFSPVGVVSLGWKFNRTYSAQLNLLGTSAVMLQFSADLH